MPKVTSQLCGRHGPPPAVYLAMSGRCLPVTAKLGLKPYKVRPPNDTEVNL